MILPNNYTPLLIPILNKRSRGARSIGVDPTTARPHTWVCEDEIDDPPNPWDVLAPTLPRSLHDLLTSTFEADAHVTAYTFPGLAEEGWPRINKPLLQDLDPGPEQYRPHLAALFVDLDRLDGHGPWPTAAAAADAVAAAAAAAAGWGVYATRGGLRMVRPLLAPVLISTSNQADIEAHIRGAVAAVGALIDEHPTLSGSVGVDYACTDWTRLFRLPFVKRDAEHQKWASAIQGMGPVALDGYTRIYKPGQSPAELAAAEEAKRLALAQRAATRREIATGALRRRDAASDDSDAPTVPVVPSRYSGTVHDACRYMDAIPPPPVGERHTTLRNAGNAVAGLFALTANEVEQAMLTLNDRCSVPYPTNELRKLAIDCASYGRAHPRERRARVPTTRAAREAAQPPRGRVLLDDVVAPPLDARLGAPSSYRLGQRLGRAEMFQEAMSCTGCGRPVAAAAIYYDPSVGREIKTARTCQHTKHCARCAHSAARAWRARAEVGDAIMLRAAGTEAHVIQIQVDVDAGVGVHSGVESLFAAMPAYHTRIATAAARCAITHWRALDRYDLSWASAASGARLTVDLIVYSSADNAEALRARLQATTRPPEGASVVVCQRAQRLRTAHESVDWLARACGTIWQDHAPEPQDSGRQGPSDPEDSEDVRALWRALHGRQRIRASADARKVTPPEMSGTKTLVRYEGYVHVVREARTLSERRIAVAQLHMLLALESSRWARGTQTRAPIIFLDGSGVVSALTVRAFIARDERDRTAIPSLL